MRRGYDRHLLTSLKQIGSRGVYGTVSRNGKLSYKITAQATFVESSTTKETGRVESLDVEA